MKFWKQGCLHCLNGGIQLRNKIGINTMLTITDAIWANADPSTSYKREVSAFATPQHKIINVTSNNQGSYVDFDWFEIWGHIKESGTKPSIVQMFHSHPPYMSEMSSIDFNMVAGWRIALGVPVHFYIITPNHITKYICDKKEKGSPYLEEETEKGEFKDFPNEIRLLSETIYGLSSMDDLTNQDIVDIKNQLKHSKW
jgi:hypothetical protein